MSRRLSRVALVGVVGALLVAAPALAYAAPEPPAPLTGTAPLPHGTAAGTDQGATPADAPVAGPALAPDGNTVAGLLDTGRRRPVSALYDSEWNASAPAVGFTGSIGSCTPGTTSASFRAAVIKVIDSCIVDNAMIYCN